MIITDLRKVAVAVTVVVAVKAGDGGAATTGGTTTMPIAPMMTRMIPLAVLMIKSLGYFICIQEAFNDTKNQFTIQIEKIIGIFAVMRTDHNFIRLMTKIIDLINCKARAMFFPAKTNPLVGYEEEAGILGIKMVFTLLGSPNSQSDRCNG